MRLNFRILCWLIHQNKPKAWCILLCRLQGNPAARRLQSAEGGVGQLSHMLGKKSTTVETDWYRCMWPPGRKSDAKGGIDTCSNQSLKAWHKAYADKTITCVPCTVFDLVVHIDSSIFKSEGTHVICIIYVSSSFIRREMAGLEMLQPKPMIATYHVPDIVHSDACCDIYLHE